MQDRDILAVGESIIDGYRITQAEAVQFSEVPDDQLPFLLAVADKIRRHYRGDDTDLCSIINGRSGRCTEDCVFCAQSAFHRTDVATYPLLGEADLVAAAKQAQDQGALRFAIVTSGRGTQADPDFGRIVQALQAIKRETGLYICCSLGFLSPDTARQLKAAGVSRYHHNIEACREYYPEICSTHSYEDRLRTIAAAQECGLEVCSGGIIGLGETPKQRLAMAFELQALQVDCVPINILNPIAGTPLAGSPPLTPLAILRTFALFRFILPDCSLRTAGGRELHLRDVQALALTGGMDGMMIGGYLTTGGRDSCRDLTMIEDLGRGRRRNIIALHSDVEGGI